MTPPAGRRPAARSSKRASAPAARKRAAAKATKKTTKAKITAGSKTKTAGTTKAVAPTDMSVKASVQRDINELAKRDPKIATSGLAALALSLAAEMDAKNSATSKSMCARALSETLEKIEALAPPAKRKDAIDELASRRTTRRRRAAS